MSRRAATVLRLYLLDDRRRLDLDRATLIIDRLGVGREVEGAPPEWRIHYETEDHSLAMETCARELGDLDPHWLEYFDFSVLRSRDRVRSRRGEFL